MCYKVSNTCYKVCNMRYKLCNKNFQVHRKNFQGLRKNFLPENRLTDGRKDSCIIANAHFQGHRMGNQGFKGGGICNYTGLQGGKSSKIYALACPKISWHFRLRSAIWASSIALACTKIAGACANFTQSRRLRSDARKVGWFNQRIRNPSLVYGWKGQLYTRNGLI